MNINKKTVAKFLKNSENNQALINHMYEFFDRIDKDIDEDKYIKPEVVEAALMMYDHEIAKLESQKKGYMISGGTR